MKVKILSALLIIGSAMFSGCSGAKIKEVTGGEGSDEILIEKIKIIVKNNVSIDKISTIIDVPPMLNTIKKTDFYLFSKVSVLRDSDHPKEFLDPSKDHPLVYWKRYYDKELSMLRVVGVYYDKKENPNMFFALLGD